MASATTLGIWDKGVEEPRIPPPVPCRALHLPCLLPSTPKLQGICVFWSKASDFHMSLYWMGVRWGCICAMYCCGGFQWGQGGVSRGIAGHTSEMDVFTSEMGVFSSEMRVFTQ